MQNFGVSQSLFALEKTRRIVDKHNKESRSLHGWTLDF